jgi:hypothetical protein
MIAIARHKFSIKIAEGYSLLFSEDKDGKQKMILEGQKVRQNYPASFL